MIRHDDGGPYNDAEFEAALDEWEAATCPRCKAGVCSAHQVTHPLIDAVMTLPAFQEAAGAIDHEAEGRPWVAGKRAADEYTAEERAAILESMRQTSNRFYASAVHAGCHAFIEFAGLMNEYIKACEGAEARGEAWVHASGHGDNLKLEDFQIAYIREKLGCIFGDQVLIDELE